MNNKKYLERFPKKFRTIRHTNKLIQIELIPDKDDEDYTAIDVSLKDLNTLYSRMIRNSHHESCYGVRDSCDYFNTQSVQELLDYAIQASRSVTKLKKLAVDGELAEYDSSGKFKIVGTNDEKS